MVMERKSLMFAALTGQILKFFYKSKVSITKGILDTRKMSTFTHFVLVFIFSDCSLTEFISLLNVDFSNLLSLSSSLDYLFFFFAFSKFV
jgi:hypothetical protein